MSLLPLNIEPKNKFISRWFSKVEQLSDLVHLTQNPSNAEDLLSSIAWTKQVIKQIADEIYGDEN